MSTITGPAARRMLLVEDVAERYGVSPKTVRAWAAQRLIPYSRPAGTRRLLFSADDLVEWERGEERP